MLDFLHVEEELLLLLGGHQFEFDHMLELEVEDLLMVQVLLKGNVQILDFIG